MKGVPPKTPPLLRVDKASERVSDDIQVWGYVEAVNVGVIPNVTYDRDFFLRNYSNQAFEESGCPYSSS